MFNTKDFVVSLISVTNRFSSSIVVKTGNTFVDGKSILGLLCCVTSIPTEFYVNGEDSELAKTELESFFESKHSTKITFK